MIKIKTILLIFVILIANGLLSIGNCSDLKNENILIIGGGSSGIAAATKLIENGFTNVNILEAENRIGGRVYTRKFGVNDTNIDMGAQWCHGIKNNVVYELASQYNLLKNDNITPQFYYVQSNGVEISKAIGDQFLDIFFNITENNTELDTFEGSIGDYVTNKYTTAVKNIDYNETISNEFLRFYELFLGLNEAYENWQQTSGVSSAAYETCEGSQMLAWKGSGYRIILDILMKKYPDPTKDLHLENIILFNTTVTKIITDDNSTVRVLTSDHKEFIADKVIVTVSLGVLKERYKEMFQPELSLKKQKAIETLQIGTIDKLYLEFETQWWPNELEGINIIQTMDFPESLSNSTKWLTRLVGFYTNDYYPNILCGWISESHGKYYEYIDDDIIEEEVINYLEKLINNKYKMSKLKNIVRTKWYSNPHFRGTWSYRGIAAQKLNVTNLDLAEPIKDENGKNVILFAGEATHNTHFSTVHGAIETGWRAAQEIIDDL